MTYAYIESVHPGFKQSSQIFPQKISYKQFETPSQPITSNSSNYIDQTAKYTPILPSVNPSNKISTDKYDWSNYTTNNLKYYKDPIPEQFSNVNDEHNVHVDHILKCQQCKSVIIKQLQLDIDKIKMDELMELFSFILFGVFILLLLDRR